MDSAPLTAAWRPPRRSARTARWAVIGVLLVMAALTAGWPLIDQAVGDGESLPAGAVLELGPDDDTATLRVTGAGWVLSRSGSDPRARYALHRGGVDLAATYVALPATTDAARLWAGLRAVQSVADGGSRLGGPRRVTSAGGADGETGTLTRDGRAGSATVWPAPGGGYVVEVTVLATKEAGGRALADAAAVARSVTFPPEAS
ncbi:hypothetical protein [Streptomyces sp. NPDC051569]|uniref:hypothetical protein n=1 Tax=Streptomyces sp. NPDC051569 TaxID=3365661 RepID=UPI00378DFA6D